MLPEPAAHDGPPLTAYGWKAAIFYTLIESAKRHGHEPYAYLKDLLERLPGMHLSEIDTLLPSNWRPSTAAHVQELAAS